MSALTALRKIRVGPVSCLIKENVTPERCHKCWATGHKMASCKGPDYRGRCYKCGKTGHTLASCTEAECCLRCNGGHRTSNCQVAAATPVAAGTVAVVSSQGDPSGNQRVEVVSPRSNSQRPTEEEEFFPNAPAEAPLSGGTRK